MSSALDTVWGTKKLDIHVQREDCGEIEASEGLVEKGGVTNM